MHQLHESCYCTFREPGEGSGAKKSDGLPTRPAYRAVPYGINSGSNDFTRDKPCADLCVASRIQCSCQQATAIFICNADTGDAEPCWHYCIYGDFGRKLPCI